MANALPNININTGELRIIINNDPDKVIVFNPEDTLFIEKFYAFTARLQAYNERMIELVDDNELDAQGIPKNSKARLKLMSETSSYVRAQVDDMFGENAAQNVFGDTTSLDAFAQFVAGITPFVKNARGEKIAKYTAKKVSKKASTKTKAG